jgi:hypothetical protein
MNGFWISFTFTCGIFVGQYLPRFLRWLLNKIEESIEESEDTE